MQIHLDTTNRLLDHFDTYDIIPETTKEQLARLTADNFLFREQLDLAESIHLHIKVPSTDKLPHDDLFKHGGIPQNEKEGYIKYAFPSGVHLIFSSIPVSQEERAGLVLYNFPHLDHIGIDIRKDDSESYQIFNKIPALADENFMPHKRQGGDGQNVYCCHVQVNEKYWVYPKGRPHFEFAFGPLVVSDDVFGCDLRPADPSLLIPEEQLACCGSSTSSHAAGTQKSVVQSSGYYKKEDLGKFRNISDFQQDLGNSFFAYYGKVFKDSALSAREKSIIALAVSHALQCPYCIDAFSADTIAKGYTNEQVMEAVHVAAAIRSGATLVHGVQMMNRVKELS